MSTETKTTTKTTTNREKAIKHLSIAGIAIHNHAREECDSLSFHEWRIANRASNIADWLAGCLDPGGPCAITRDFLIAELEHLARILRIQRDAK